MTAPAPDGGQPLYGLHVVFGDRWKEPTADYACRCGFTDSAKGAAAVRAFTNTIRRIHRTQCPLTTPQEHTT
jgi:hypothetical protein